MLQDIFGTTMFVYLATASQAIGLLVTRQVILRLLVLLGSALYIVYYYTHLGQPQWEAIVGSSLIGLANLIGLLLLLHSRMPIGMKPQDRVVFESLGGLEPGQFRRLMRVGEVMHTTEHVRLTEEGVVPGNLYFVLAGDPIVTKDGQAFRIPSNCFVGEVAFKLGCGASATVTLQEGGTFVIWPREELDALLNRAPALQQAFDALIARDMATKVARSTPVASACVSQHPTPPASAFGLQYAV